MPTPYEKEMERSRKLLVEIDEDADFDNGPEDVLKENFSDHESFSEHDTESEEDGDYGRLITFSVFSTIGNMDGLYNKIDLTWQKLTQSRATTLIVENSNSWIAFFNSINCNSVHKIC
ncbi:hypothetical protein AVEN_91542-1 [Araneus ventricosus]|uniref:Uncharacterized protein n=1 Tax=Araneus ventricosus TaxID=182803 RepID=A0A4Y2BIX5_ARAVE|nr:hypothetical protein AVEN_91542-1 [Araneus ventricosus]